MNRVPGEIRPLAAARGTVFPVDLAIRVADLANPLSLDGQRDRRLCAGGRPTAGGRLLLLPISQGSCRGAVMRAPKFFGRAGVQSPSQICSYFSKV